MKTENKQVKQIKKKILTMNKTQKVYLKNQIKIFIHIKKIYEMQKVYLKNSN